MMRHVAVGKLHDSDGQPVKAATRVSGDEKNTNWINGNCHSRRSAHLQRLNDTVDQTISRGAQWMFHGNLHMENVNQTKQDNDKNG